MRINSMRPFLWLFAAVAIATALKICLASLTYGTNDASMWEASAQLIRDGMQLSIYQQKVIVSNPAGDPFDFQIFNHPPFMVFVLSGLNRLYDSTGMPVHVSLRLLDAIADAGSMVLTAEIVRSITGTIPLWSMILIALAPAWIFISGFHANTDPLLLFLLLLTAWLIDVHGRNGWGAASFTIATGIKIVPFLLLPALLMYFRTWKDRLRAIFFLAAFWSVTAFEWLSQTPRALLRNVAGYGSANGHWGIGWILSNFPAFHYLPERIYNRAGRYVLVCGLLAMAVWLNRRQRRVSLFHQFGILLFAMLALTPGFALQYLAWLTPWLATLPWAFVASYVAASGLFSGAVYTYWNAGLPWYYADSVTTGDWKGLLSLIGFATWLTVTLVLERMTIAPTYEAPSYIRRHFDPVAPADRGRHR
jgi:hypothetical protein